MNKQPERTARTRQSLIDAFWKTAEGKGVRNVTVRDVTKAAGLNRSTFYAYFEDIPALLEETEEEIVVRWTSQLRSALSAGDVSDLHTIILRGVELFSQYDAKIFLLLGDNGDPNFRRKLRREASDIFSGMPSGVVAPEEQDYVVAYLSSAAIGLLQYWHESGRKMKVEEILDLLRRLGFTGLRGYSQTVHQEMSAETENGV